MKLKTLRSGADQVLRSKAATRVLLLAFVVCAIGWTFRIQPKAVIVGSVSDFVGAMATAGALIAAVYELRVSRVERMRSDDERVRSEVLRQEAMARSVSVKSLLRQDGKRWVVDYEIHNGGDYPIDDVVIVIRESGSGGEDEDPQAGSVWQMVIGTVIPGEQLKDTARPSFRPNFAGVPFSNQNRLASVVFTDTWQNNWQRGPSVLRKRVNPARVC